MALTKKDLQAIEGIVEKHADELAGVVNKGFQDVERRFENVNTRFDALERRLDVLDVWQSDFRDLVKLLADKNVLTHEEAARLGVKLDRVA